MAELDEPDLVERPRLTRWLVLRYEDDLTIPPPRATGGVRIVSGDGFSQASAVPFVGS